MKKIYKYPLLDVVTNIQMPFGSVFVKVALQNGVPNIWAETPNSTCSYVARVIQCFGTGHLIPNDAVYLGTVLLHDDMVVSHCYEVTR